MVSVRGALRPARDVGNEIDGITERDHAYVTDGRLPERFEDVDYRVPLRFHAMLRGNAVVDADHPLHSLNRDE